MLRKHLRSFELVYRLGGEEFLVLLPGLALPEAAALAERVRVGIESAGLAGLPVTASFGVAGASGVAVQFESMFREADAALYEAKERGHNRVEPSALVDEDPPAAVEHPRLRSPLSRN